MKETLTKYLKNNFDELTKVVWPTKNQAIRLTVIVLIFCVVVATFLGLTDFLFTKLQGYVITTLIR